jgi:hypothetical protein
MGLVLFCVVFPVLFFFNRFFCTCAREVSSPLSILRKDYVFVYAHFLKIIRGI